MSVRVFIGLRASAAPQVLPSRSRDVVWRAGAAASVIDRGALTVSDRLPNVIDRHVASRMRLRRLEIGLSQETVADALGVTFQQFQKYERTINRISAGALYKLALALEVPVTYFFEGVKYPHKKI